MLEFKDKNENKGFDDFVHKSATHNDCYCNGAHLNAPCKILCIITQFAMLCPIKIWLTLCRRCFIVTLDLFVHVCRLRHHQGVPNNSFISPSL